MKAIKRNIFIALGILIIPFALFQNWPEDTIVWNNIKAKINSWMAMDDEATTETSATINLRTIEENS